MILVVGGLGAGKRKFIREELGYAPEQLSSVPEEGTPVLWGLEALVPLPPLEDLLGREVVVCREVGCGVVPLDRADRDRRWTGPTGTGGRQWGGCAVTWPPGRRRCTG